MYADFPFIINIYKYINIYLFIQLNFMIVV